MSGSEELQSGHQCIATESSESENETSSCVSETLKSTSNLSLCEKSNTHNSSADDIHPLLPISEKDYLQTDLARSSVSTGSVSSLNPDDVASNSGGSDHVFDNGKLQNCSDTDINETVAIVNGISKSTEGDSLSKRSRNIDDDNDSRNHEALDMQCNSSESSEISHSLNDSAGNISAGSSDANETVIKFSKLGNSGDSHRELLNSVSCSVRCARTYSGDESELNSDISGSCSDINSTQKKVKENETTKISGSGNVDDSSMSNSIQDTGSDDSLNKIAQILEDAIEDDVIPEIVKSDNKNTSAVTRFRESNLSNSSSTHSENNNDDSLRNISPICEQSFRYVSVSRDGVPATLCDNKPVLANLASNNPKSDNDNKLVLADLSGDNPESDDDSNKPILAHLSCDDLEIEDDNDNSLHDISQIAEEVVEDNMIFEIPNPSVDREYYDSDDKMSRDVKIIDTMSDCDASNISRDFKESLLQMTSGIPGSSVAAENNFNVVKCMNNTYSGLGEYDEIHNSKGSSGSFSVYKRHVDDSICMLVSITDSIHDPAKSHSSISVSSEEVHALKRASPVNAINVDDVPEPVIDCDDDDNSLHDISMPTDERSANGVCVQDTDPIIPVQCTESFSHSKSESDDESLRCTKVEFKQNIVLKETDNGSFAETQDIPSNPSSNSGDKLERSQVSKEDSKTKNNKRYNTKVINVSPRSVSQSSELISKEKQTTRNIEIRIPVHLSDPDIKLNVNVSLINMTRGSDKTSRVETINLDGKHDIQSTAIATVTSTTSPLNTPNYNIKHHADDTGVIPVSVNHITCSQASQRAGNNVEHSKPECLKQETENISKLKNEMLCRKSEQPPVITITSTDACSNNVASEAEKSQVSSDNLKPPESVARYGQGPFLHPLSREVSLVDNSSLSENESGFCDDNDLNPLTSLSMRRISRSVSKSSDHHTSGWPPESSRFGSSSNKGYLNANIKQCRESYEGLLQQNTTIDGAPSSCLSILNTESNHSHVQNHVLKSEHEISVASLPDVKTPLKLQDNSDSSLLVAKNVKGKGKSTVLCNVNVSLLSENKHVPQNSNAFTPKDTFDTLLLPETKPLDKSTTGKHSKSKSKSPNKTQDSLCTNEYSKTGSVVAKHCSKFPSGIYIDVADSYVKPCLDSFGASDATLPLSNNGNQVDEKMADVAINHSVDLNIEHPPVVSYKDRVLRPSYDEHSDETVLEPSQIERSDATIPEQSQIDRSDATVPEPSQVVGFDATIPEASQIVHSDATIPEASQVICSDATIPEASQVICSDAMIPEASQIVHSDATIPEASQVNYSDATIPEASQFVCSNRAVQESLHISSSCDTVMEPPQVVCSDDAILESPRVISSDVMVTEHPHISGTCIKGSNSAVALSAIDTITVNGTKYSVYESEDDFDAKTGAHAKQRIQKESDDILYNSSDDSISVPAYLPSVGSSPSKAYDDDEISDASDDDIEVVSVYRPIKSPDLPGMVSPVDTANSESIFFNGEQFTDADPDAAMPQPMILVRNIFCGEIPNGNDTSEFMTTLETLSTEAGEGDQNEDKDSLMTFQIPECLSNAEKSVIVQKVTSQMHVPTEMCAEECAQPGHQEQSFEEVSDVEDEDVVDVDDVDHDDTVDVEDDGDVDHDDTIDIEDDGDIEDDEDVVQLLSESHEYSGRLDNDQDDNLSDRVMGSEDTDLADIVQASLEFVNRLLATNQNTCSASTSHDSGNNIVAPVTELSEDEEDQPVDPVCTYTKRKVPCKRGLYLDSTANNIDMDYNGSSAAEVSVHKDSDDEENIVISDVDDEFETSEVSEQDDTSSSLSAVIPTGQKRFVTVRNGGKGRQLTLEKEDSPQRNIFKASLVNLARKLSLEEEKGQLGLINSLLYGSQKESDASKLELRRRAENSLWSNKNIVPINGKTPYVRLERLSLSEITAISKAHGSSDVLHSRNRNKTLLKSIYSISYNEESCTSSSDENSRTRTLLQANLDRDMANVCVSPKKNIEHNGIKRGSAKKITSRKARVSLASSMSQNREDSGICYQEDKSQSKSNMVVNQVIKRRPGRPRKIQYVLPNGCNQPRTKNETRICEKNQNSQTITKFESDISPDSKENHERVSRVSSPVVCLTRLEPSDKGQRRMSLPVFVGRTSLMSSERTWTQRRPSLPSNRDSHRRKLIPLSEGSQRRMSMTSSEGSHRRASLTLSEGSQRRASIISSEGSLRRTSTLSLEGSQRRMSMTSSEGSRRRTSIPSSEGSQRRASQSSSDSTQCRTSEPSSEGSEYVPSCTILTSNTNLHTTRSARHSGIDSLKHTHIKSFNPLVKEARSLKRLQHSEADWNLGGGKRRDRRSSDTSQAESSLDSDTQMAENLVQVVKKKNGEDEQMNADEEPDTSHMISSNAVHRKHSTSENLALRRLMPSKDDSNFVRDNLDILKPTDSIQMKDSHQEYVNKKVSQAKPAADSHARTIEPRSLKRLRPSEDDWNFGYDRLKVLRVIGSNQSESHAEVTQHKACLKPTDSIQMKDSHLENVNKKVSQAKPAADSHARTIEHRSLKRLRPSEHDWNFGYDRLKVLRVIGSNQSESHAEVTQHKACLNEYNSETLVDKTPISGDVKKKRRCINSLENKLVKKSEQQQMLDNTPSQNNSYPFVSLERLAGSANSHLLAGGSGSTKANTPPSSQHLPKGKISKIARHLRFQGIFKIAPDRLIPNSKTERKVPSSKTDRRVHKPNVKHKAVKFAKRRPVNKNLVKNRKGAQAR